MGGFYGCRFGRGKQSDVDMVGCVAPASVNDVVAGAILRARVGLLRALFDVPFFSLWGDVVRFLRRAARDDRVAVAATSAAAGEVVGGA